MTLMKPEIRAVLFDKDGTLIDYERSWGATNRRAAALAARGDDVLERRLLELAGVDPQIGRTRADSLFAAGNTREIATCFTEAGSPIAVEELVAALDRLFVSAVDDAVPVADLGEVFGRLRRAGMVIGIASSDSEGAIRAMVERFGVAGHIAFIAGYDSGYGTKPGPGMVTAFAQAVGLSPREIAVVGDNLHDMRMATAGGAGLRVAVLTGTGDRDTLGGESDVCLPSISSLLVALPNISVELTHPQGRPPFDEPLRSALSRVAEVDSRSAQRSTGVPVLTSHVGGAYLAADPQAETFSTIDPATGEVLAEIAIAGEAEVNRAVELALRAQRGWGAMTGAERGRILQKVAVRLRERNGELALLETSDTGKPIQETQAVDVLLGADCIEYFAGLAAGLAGEHVDLGPSAFGYTRREPLGVVAGIGAWNYPIQIACWKAAPALAAGNAFIFKPAELTPLTALKLAEVMTECGVPAGVFNVVQGDGRTGRLLSRHPGIAKISLTGEVGTGRKVMADASATLKQVTLELGGKSPLIVFPDADLDDAVGGALLANFYSAGEVCSNGTRVFVHEEIRKAFLERLVARTRAMVVGDPKDPATQVGALISHAHMRKVLSYIEEGRRGGARIIVGGSRVTTGDLARGCFVQPTIFDGCTDDMAIVGEEIFGPVMTVLSFTDEDEVIARANDTPFGLAAGVFTRDLARAHRVVARLEAGTTWINTYNVTPIELPFGGAKQSGLGRENGRAALLAHTQVKSVYVNLGRVDAPY